MKENVWKTYTDEQVKELEALSGRYKAFLNAGKTERECAAEAIRLARAAGYQSLEEVQQTGKKQSKSPVREPFRLCASM